jgi:hypothetical protein
MEASESAARHRVPSTRLRRGESTGALGAGVGGSKAPTLDVTPPVHSDSVASNGSITYPVAQREGSLVWAEDLAVAGDRPPDLTCVACQEAVLLRAGSQRRPHFAHRLAVNCSAGETVLHATAIRVLSDAVSAAIVAELPYPIHTWCEICDSAGVGDLAKHRGAHLEINKALSPVVRPDLTMVDSTGKPRYVIEVIVTHAPEEAALSAIKQAELPVICVWPTWDTIHHLRNGLSEEGRRTPGSNTGFHRVIDGPCSHPRHPRHRVGPCANCGDESRAVGVELGSLDCYRCQRPMPVLDVIDFDGQHLHTITASASSLVGVQDIARELGVLLRMTSSKTAGTAYLMHHCPSCEAKSGDFFVYGPGYVDTSVQRRTYRVCPKGHWDHVETRAWPEGPAPHRVGSSTGSWGTDEDEDDDDEPLVRVVDTTRLSPGQVARMMVYGSDYR